MNIRLSESDTPRWLLLLAIILVVIGVVIWQLPIKWFSGMVSNATQCKVLLVDPSGRPWRGGTAIGFSEPALDGQTCRPPLAMTERLYWNTECSLQQRSCSIRIETAALGSPLLVTASLDGITIKENELQLPAEILEVLGAPWTILHPRGDLTARWSDLRITEQGNSGSIRANLDDLSSPVSLIKPLGSYKVEATLSGHGVNYTLDTNEGPLILRAEGSFSAGGKASGHGEASATPESQEALSSLLGLIGRRQGDTYRLVF